MSRVLRTRYRVNPLPEEVSVTLPQHVLEEQRYLDAVRREAQGYTSVVQVRHVDGHRQPTTLYLEAYLQRQDVRLNEQHDGRTFLSQCIAIRRFDLLGVLLGDSRVDVNVPNQEDGYTPLMEACAHKSLEAVRMLLQRQDLDVNYRDRSNRFALYEAAWQGAYDVVIALTDDSRVVASMQIPGSGWNAVDAAVDGCLDALENMSKFISPQTEQVLVMEYTKIIVHLTDTLDLDFDNAYMEFFKAKVLSKYMRD